MSCHNTSVYSKGVYKNQNFLHAKLIVTQSWYDSVEIFSISHFAIFSNRNHFDWSVLFNFETT